MFILIISFYVPNEKQLLNTAIYNLLSTWKNYPALSEGPDLQ